MNCNESFEELKRKLTTTLILVVPDDSGGMKIYNDAFGQGLEYILGQYD